MLKSFASIIELDITKGDIELIFSPFASLWRASINEIYSNYKDSYFNKVLEAIIKEANKTESLTYVNKAGRDSEVLEAIIKENELYDLFDIGSITVDGDRGYIEVFSLEALYKQNKSYYIFRDIDNIEYIVIHFNNFESAYSKRNILINIKYLFCDYMFNNNFYKNIYPRVEEINYADIEGSPLSFDTIQTNEISVTLRNDDGFFDDFNNIYGNRFLVRQIFDNQVYSRMPVDFKKSAGDYNEALNLTTISKIIFSGFIQKPEYSFLDTITITALDLRASFTTYLPKNIFSEREYPDLKNFPTNVQSGESIIDTARTLAAGRGIIVKLKPIKYYTPDILNYDLIPEVVFEIVDTTLHSIENIVSKVDILDNNKLKPHIYFIETPQSETDIIEKDGKVISGEIEIFIPEFKDYGKGLERVWTLDKEKGLLIFRGHNQVHSITDTNDNLYEIYAEIDIPPYNSLTLIREILETYENISFIKENYNIENWILEENRAREIAVLLDNDNKKTILDLIGELCFLEQGRLEIEDNKINFLNTRYRENKAKYRIKQECMGRIDKTVEEGEYLSSLSIKYDVLKSTYTNTFFEEEAIKRHRITAYEEFETLLKNKDDAISLSNEIMRSRYLLKEYYTFEYYETLDFLKLFDIVEFEYKRENNTYFIKPCLCEIVKLNIFDNIIKLREL